MARISTTDLMGRVKSIRTFHANGIAPSTEDIADLFDAIDRLTIERDGLSNQNDYLHSENERLQSKIAGIETCHIALAPQTEATLRTAQLPAPTAPVASEHIGWWFEDVDGPVFQDRTDTGMIYQMCYGPYSSRDAARAAQQSIRSTRNEAAPEASDDPLGKFLRSASPEDKAAYGRALAEATHIEAASEAAQAAPAKLRTARINRGNAVHYVTERGYPLCGSGNSTHMHNYRKAYAQYCNGPVTCKKCARIAAGRAAIEGRAK